MLVLQASALCLPLGQQAEAPVEVKNRGKPPRSTTNVASLLINMAAIEENILRSKLAWRCCQDDRWERNDA
jgi:hypothetical protein